jgi:hypothetical protein
LVDEVGRRFPEEDRLMPTRLGNVLRSAEDRASLAGGDIRALVLERFDEVPPSLREQSDLHRSRLDVYCTLCFVWIGLTVWALVATLPSTRAFIALVPLALTAFSYLAANSAAESYGLCLRAMSNVLCSAASPDAPPNSAPKNGHHPVRA